MEVTTMSKELEIIKNRNEKIKINHMIGNRRIANEELKECSIAIENAILEIEKSLTKFGELKATVKELLDIPITVSTFSGTSLLIKTMNKLNKLVGDKDE